MNRLAVDFIDRDATGKKPVSLFFAHKAVHPDAEQPADGTLAISALGGYVLPPRYENLYQGKVFPKRPRIGISTAIFLESAPYVPIAVGSIAACALGRFVGVQRMS